MPERAHLSVATAGFARGEELPSGSRCSRRSWCRDARAAWLDFARQAASRLNNHTVGMLVEYTMV